MVSVAAGGGGTPIRPVQVEGTYTPPAYLLADSSGRLHTAGVDRQRPDLGMAIADVRDILGHPQIVVAGATWPAELVFRARMYNPLAAIGKYLRGKPDVVALPYPDGWPEEKVEVYAELVEQLDVIVEPLPESVALSGYMRALGLVTVPDRRHPNGVGATGVYSDGRSMLVVAVDGDDEQPTESVDVPIAPDSMRDARSADNVVIEVMAAARAIGADTSTVLLAGNGCFNDALRLAFQNHLGHRLKVADHPMHALVLGAAHLLVTDPEVESEAGQVPSETGTGQGGSSQVSGPQSGAASPRATTHQAPAPPTQQAPAPSQPATHQAPAPSEAATHQSAPFVPPPQPAGARPPVVTYGPGYPTTRPAEPSPDEEATTEVSRDEVPRGLPPNLAELGSRFTRPPTSQPGAAPPSGAVPLSGSPFDQQWGEPNDDEDKGKGKRWKRMFGSNAVIGAVVLGIALLPPERPAQAAACPLGAQITTDPRGVDTVRELLPADCAPGANTLRYRLPDLPGILDPGPPLEI
ncbi:hypothetical protein D5S18_23540 [Nocardia panacis]|uniref:Uncharacterized protein n=1 Tax=Nocardia panacis TaxID=2340916 RepID=A0A3A4KFM4_9NOCA|nr:hypothetical protein D5S18_23540 [Nocardia panacis]